MKKHHKTKSEEPIRLSTLEGAKILLYKNKVEIFSKKPVAEEEYVQVIKRFKKLCKQTELPYNFKDYKDIAYCVGTGIINNLPLLRNTKPKVVAYPIT